MHWAMEDLSTKLPKAKKNSLLQTKPQLFISVQRGLVCSDIWNVCLKSMCTLLWWAKNNKKKTNCGKTRKLIKLLFCAVPFSGISPLSSLYTCCGSLVFGYHDECSMTLLSHDNTLGQALLILFNRCIWRADTLSKIPTILELVI